MLIKQKRKLIPFLKTKYVCKTENHQIEVRFDKKPKQQHLEKLFKFLEEDGKIG